MESTLSKGKKNSPQVPTLSEVWEAYKLTPGRLEKTTEQYKSTIDRCILDWWHRPINSITRQEIRDRHSYLSQANQARGEGRAQADQIMRILNALFNFAIRKYRIEGVQVLQDNPVMVLNDLKQWNRKPPRDEIVTPSQMPLFWKELENFPNSNDADFMKLVLLTGLNRALVMGLTWDQVDLRKGALLLDGQLKPIPVSTFVLEVLKRRHSRRRSTKETYVFNSAKDDNKRHGEFRGSLEIERKLKFPCSPVVLARTFQSVAIGLSVSDAMILALTNKKQRLFRGVHPSFESMQKATESITTEILESAKESNSIHA